MPARRATRITREDLAAFERPEVEVEVYPVALLEAQVYRLNIKQLCDGDLTYLERKQAEQRIIEEL